MVDALTRAVPYLKPPILVFSLLGSGTLLYYGHEQEGWLGAVVFLSAIVLLLGGGGCYGFLLIYYPANAHEFAFAKNLKIEVTEDERLRDDAEKTK